MTVCDGPNCSLSTLYNPGPGGSYCSAKCEEEDRRKQPEKAPQKTPDGYGEVIGSVNVPGKSVTSFFGDPKYGRLRHTLVGAYRLAAEGKGAIRHGNGKGWDDQPIFWITQHVGLGFPLGQAVKKIEESLKLDKDASIRELQGAICYIAAAIQHIEDEQNASSTSSDH